MANDALGIRVIEFPLEASEEDLNASSKVLVDTPQGTKALDGNILGSLAPSIAEKFNKNKSYEDGDVVMHRGALRRFKGPHQGDWTDSDNDATDVVALIEEASTQYVVFPCSPEDLPDGDIIKSVVDAGLHPALKFAEGENITYLPLTANYTRNGTEFLVFASGPFNISATKNLESDSSEWEWSNKCPSDLRTAALETIAPSFKSRSGNNYTWKEGEVCVYDDGHLYVFIRDHEGPWTGADAHEVTILEVLSTMSSSEKPTTILSAPIYVGGEGVVQKGTVVRARAVDSKYVVDATSAFRVCSDNLNQFPYLNSSGTSYTVEFTVNPDGSVKINGTATGGHALFYLNSNVSGGGVILPAGVYSVPLVSQSGVAFQVIKVGTSTDISSNNGDGKTFTLSETTRIYIRIRVASGTAVSNLVVYPMICRGKYCGKYTAPLGAEHAAGTGIVVEQDGFVNFISSNSDELSVTCKVSVSDTEKPIYVQKKSDVIRVFSRIKKEYDLCIEFRKQGGLVDGEPVGGNQLFDFCRWYYVKRKFGCVSTTIDDAVQIQINGTDYFGPYKVFAVNNINGDLPESNDFTGGNHQYNNQGSGSSATARCSSITLDVDGAVDVGEFFNSFADKIKIHWINYVQATNTKKEDGSGREVLCENYEMTFDGIKFVVKNNITALEAVRITTYYGLQGQQFPTTSGTYMLYYEGSKTTRSAAKTNTTGECGDKNCRLIKQVGNAYANINSLGGVKMPSYDIEMTDFDLGDFSNVESVSSSAHASGGKVYFNLIRKDDGVLFAANDVLRFIGSYRFYDSGLD